MSLYERLHPDQLPVEYHDERIATGPVLIDGALACSTCGRPTTVYSPDFDSAELRHAAPITQSPFVRLALAKELKAKDLS